MTILEEKSKRFADCIKNLYEKKMYSVEYAILQLEKFRDNNKIIESDYEEYYNYFCVEMDKKNIVEVIEETTEKQKEIVENEQLDTEENDFADEVIQENKEVESAE